MRKIKVLHVFGDCIFFDSVSDLFDKVDVLDNVYAYYLQNRRHEFKYIKKAEKITVFTNKEEYLKLFSDNRIDVVYFYSFPGCYYNLVRKHVAADKIVIWWEWGYDIYDNVRGLRPLVDLSLYKSKTKDFFTTYLFFKKSFIRNCIKKVVAPFYRKAQKDAISRIDYCSTVFPIEYEILKKLDFFTAKPFLLQGSIDYMKSDFVYNFDTGNILVNNSGRALANHLDILDVLERVNIGSRKIILPLSYGDVNFIKFLKKRINTSCISKSMQMLDTFLPYDEYFAIINSCTHAVFGAIRQHAVGNILSCFRCGVKVFLYNDSLGYKHFKEAGFIVYAIESDLNEIELSKNLTQSEAYNNYKLSFCGIYSHNDAVNRLKNAFIEIIENRLV